MLSITAYRLFSVQFKLVFFLRSNLGNFIHCLQRYLLMKFLSYSISGVIIIIYSIFVAQFSFSSSSSLFPQSYFSYILCAKNISALRSLQFSTLHWNNKIKKVWQNQLLCDSTGIVHTHIHAIDVWTVNRALESNNKKWKKFFFIAINIIYDVWNNAIFFVFSLNRTNKAK